MHGTMGAWGFARSPSFTWSSICCYLLFVDVMSFQKQISHAEHAVRHLSVDDCVTFVNSRNNSDNDRHPHNIKRSHNYNR